MAAPLHFPFASGDPAGGEWKGNHVRTATTACLMIVLLLIGVGVGRAYDTNETIINVEVNSARRHTSIASTAEGSRVNA